MKVLGYLSHPRRYAAPLRWNQTPVCDAFWSALQWHRSPLPSVWWPYCCGRAWITRLKELTDAKSKPWAMNRGPGVETKGLVGGWNAEEKDNDDDDEAPPGHRCPREQARSGLWFSSSTSLCFQAPNSFTFTGHIASITKLTRFKTPSGPMKLIIFVVPASLCVLFTLRSYQRRWQVYTLQRPGPDAHARYFSLRMRTDQQAKRESGKEFVTMVTPVVSPPI